MIHLALIGAACLALGCAIGLVNLWLFPEWTYEQRTWFGITQGIALLAWLRL